MIKIIRTSNYIVLVLSLMVLSACSASMNRAPSASGRSDAAVQFAKTSITQADWNNYLKSYVDYVLKGASQNTTSRYGDLEKAGMSLMSYYREQAGYDFIINETAKLYAQEFTDAELNELMNFFNTPLGAKFKTKGIKVQQEAHAAFAKKMSKNETQHRAAINRALSGGLQQQ